MRLPERTEQEQDKAVRAVLHWLAMHEGWLLVVDNADDLGIVGSLLPPGNTGQLSLTTRDQVVAGMESFSVEPMERVRCNKSLRGRRDGLAAHRRMKPSFTLPFNYCPNRAMSV